MRKEMDLRVDAFIDVRIVASTTDAASSVKSREDYILGEVRAKKLTIQHLDRVKAHGELVREWSIGDDTFSIGLSRRSESRAPGRLTRRRAKKARRHG